jgi:catechol-2,3-dioxygenase
VAASPPDEFAQDRTLLIGEQMHICDIDHAGLNVRDLQTSVDWYKRVLGFEIFHKFAPTAWMIARGEMKLGLFQRPNAKALSQDDLNQTIAFTHLAFRTNADGFAAAQAELKTLNVPFDPPEDTGVAFSIFISDPDGNSLEITTYHP